MYLMLISWALLGQNDIDLPPAPPAAVNAPSRTTASAPAQTVEEMRTWLLTRLVADYSFDPQKATEIGQLLNQMDHKQLIELISVYKERAGRQRQASSNPQNVSQQQVLEQARLNQQQAEAYRDHLKREFDLRVLQANLNQNLIMQNIVNNQRMQYLTYGSYTYGVPGYGPFGYGSYGYGPAYGQYGYGVAGFGGPAMYGVPYGGPGIGYW